MKYSARIIGEPDIALNEDKMHPVAYRPRSASEKYCDVPHAKSHTNTQTATTNQPILSDRRAFVSESLLLVRGHNFVKFGLFEHAQNKVDEEGRQKITPEGMKYPVHVHHRSRTVTHSRFGFMMTTVVSEKKKQMLHEGGCSEARNENGKLLGAPHADIVQSDARYKNRLMQLYIHPAPSHSTVPAFRKATASFASVSGRTRTSKSSVVGGCRRNTPSFAGNRRLVLHCFLVQ